MGAASVKLRTLETVIRALESASVQYLVAEGVAVNAHGAAEVRELAPGIPLPLVRLTTLIAMKREANRSLDQDDVQHLSWIADDRDKEGLDE